MSASSPDPGTSYCLKKNQNAPRPSVVSRMQSINCQPETLLFYTLANQLVICFGYVGKERNLGMILVVQGTTRRATAGCVVSHRSTALKCSHNFRFYSLLSNDFTWATLLLFFPGISNYFSKKSRIKYFLRRMHFCGRNRLQYLSYTLLVRAVELSSYRGQHSSLSNRKPGKVLNILSRCSFETEIELKSSQRSSRRVLKQREQDFPCSADHYYHHDYRNANRFAMIMLFLTFTVILVANPEKLL